MHRRMFLLAVLVALATYAAATAFPPPAYASGCSGIGCAMNGIAQADHPPLLPHDPGWCLIDVHLNSCGLFGGGMLSPTAGAHSSGDREDRHSAR